MTLVNYRLHMSLASISLSSTIICKEKFTLLAPSSVVEKGIGFYCKNILKQVSLDLLSKGIASYETKSTQRSTVSCGFAVTSANLFYLWVISQLCRHQLSQINLQSHNEKRGRKNIFIHFSLFFFLFSFLLSFLFPLLFILGLWSISLAVLHWLVRNLIINYMSTKY